MRSLTTFKSAFFAGLAFVSFTAMDAQAYWGPQDRDYSWDCPENQGRDRYERGDQPRVRKNRYRDESSQQPQREKFQQPQGEKQTSIREDLNPGLNPDNMTSSTENNVPERRPVFTNKVTQDNTPLSIDKSAMARDDVFQFIMTQPGLSRFARALEASGLLNDLQGGTYTLFVPEDNAFSKATAYEFEDLLKPENKNRLRDLVAYHISQGKAFSNTPLRETRSINGKKLTLRSQNTNQKMTVNGVEVIDADLIGSNGVIHIIGKVLVP